MQVAAEQPGAARNGGPAALVSGAEGRYPRVECGRTLLECPRHRSISARSSGIVSKLSRYNSSSCNLLLKLSTELSSLGLPGSILSAFTPNCPSHASTTRPANSGTLVAPDLICGIPNQPAPWQGINAIEESCYELRYISDRADPETVARILLKHDEIVLRPAECFHPLVADTTRNPDLPHLLLKPLLGTGPWVEEPRSDHRELLATNCLRAPPDSEPQPSRACDHVK